MITFIIVIAAHNSYEQVFLFYKRKIITSFKKFTFSSGSASTLTEWCPESFSKICRQMQNIFTGNKNIVFPVPGIPDHFYINAGNDRLGVEYNSAKSFEPSKSSSSPAKAQNMMVLSLSFLLQNSLPVSLTLLFPMHCHWLHSKYCLFLLPINTFMIIMSRKQDYFPGFDLPGNICDNIIFQHGILIIDCLIILS